VFSSSSSSSHHAKDNWKKSDANLTMFSKTSKPDDNVRPVERTTTTTTTTIQKQERANTASRETVSRVIATLATPVVHFSRVVRDGFLDDVERRVVFTFDLARGAGATVDAGHVSTRQSDGAGNTSNRRSGVSRRNITETSVRRVESGV
jgi:hypothetical protein